LRRKDRALVSKDATIREIHHRVKNNLQAVSALLRLQARRVDDPAASAAIEEAVRRVASIAIVHETLATNDKDNVDFDEVISKIMTSAPELSERSSEITISQRGNFGEIPSILATPLALVLTELIHNALEHGLAKIGTGVVVSVSPVENGRTGSATESRSSESRTLEVIVSDDGAGLPEGFSLEKNMNLGLQIVTTLTENELAGTIQFERGERGTQVKIRFDAHYSRS